MYTMAVSLYQIILWKKIPATVESYSLTTCLLPHRNPTEANDLLGTPDSKDEKHTIKRNNGPRSRT